MQKLAVVKIPPKQPTQQLPVVVKPPAPAPVVVKPRAGTSPSTIIPVPKLPSIKDRTVQIQPVVSSTRPSRTRFAKGTGPVIGTQVGVAPPPPIRPAESNDWVDNEQTIPSLPPVARTVTLPSIKRLSR